MTRPAAATPGLDAGRLHTLVDVFEQRVRATPSRVAYRQYLEGVDRWHGFTWTDLSQRVRCWKVAYLREGLRAGDRIAIMAANRPDWVAADMAGLSLGLVTVALFAGDTPGNAARTLRHSGAKFLVVEQARWWDEISATDALPDLQRVVSLTAGMPRRDARAVDISNWLPMPEETLAAATHARPGPDDLAVICYTSGTTGDAKGVMLTHRNILSNVFASAQVVPLLASDVVLSFLPLAHMFERTTGYYHAIFSGTEVAFTRGIPRLREDFAEIRPTAIISVPRVFERFYSLLMRRLSQRPLSVRMLFRWTVAMGWRRYLRSQGRGGAWRLDEIFWPLLRSVIARPLIAVLGGRMRVAISGGAPLSAEVSKTFIALGLPLLQGYGLTEAGPVVSTNTLADNDPESVGLPIPGVETKTGRDGELFVRGPGIMQAYWGDPEATAAVLSTDGWLATGDRVSRLDSQRLYITGRIKELIVMSSGEKASPSRIEQELLADPLVEQVMVAGEARPYLVALVVPNREVLTEVCESLGISDDGAALEQEYLRRFGERLASLPKFAQIRRVGLVADPWTVENGMATPTFKLRRRRILQVASNVLEPLYAGHFQPPTAAAGYHVDLG